MATVNQASRGADGIDARLSMVGLRDIRFSSGEPAVQRGDLGAAKAGGEGNALSVGTLSIKRADAGVQAMGSRNAWRRREETRNARWSQ